MPPDHRPAHPSSPSDHRGVLRAAGLRVTQPRLAVLAALGDHPHSGADAVLRRVRESTPVSTQAVYDVLNVLVDRGVLRRFQPAGSVARYELRTGDNHHHVVCRSCGAVTDVDCVVGKPPCVATDTPALADFEVDEAEVTFWGRCPACRAATLSS